MGSLTRTMIVGASVLLLLTGCTPPGPQPTTSGPTTGPSSASPTATPTPTPQAPTMPALTGQELLTISATATAGGAAMDVAMTVYYPVTPTSPEGEQIAAYL